MFIMLKKTNYIIVRKIIYCQFIDTAVIIKNQKSNIEIALLEFCCHNEEMCEYYNVHSHRTNKGERGCKRSKMYLLFLQYKIISGPRQLKLLDEINLVNS